MDWWVGRHSPKPTGAPPTAAARCNPCYNRLLANRYRRRSGSTTPYMPNHGVRQKGAGEQRREQWRRAERLTHLHECVQCGTMFPRFAEGRQSSKRCEWCTDGNAEARKSTAHARRRQAVRSGEHGITWQSVGARDGWRCHLCGETVPSIAGGPTTRRGGTVDHLVPIVAGGPHTWANVALAHWECNVTRGHTGLAQLRLVG